MDEEEDRRGTNGGAVIFRPSRLIPRERRNGARTISLVTSGAGSTSLLNGITELDPGGSIEPHSHNCEESVIVIAGVVVARIDGIDHVLGPADTTFIPAGLPHCFRNHSGRERARIFWTYTSVDATRRLVADGSEHRIDQEDRTR